MSKSKKKKNKKPKDENNIIKKDEYMIKTEDPEDIIKRVGKKWYMTVPKNNKDKFVDPIYNSFEKALDRSIVPNGIEINTKNLKSFIRYKGSLLGILHKSIFFNRSFLLVALYTNNVKHAITITKKGDTLKGYPPDLPVQDKFHLLYDVNIVTPDNKKIYEDCIDAFVQKRLIEMEYTFNTLDTIILNKSGIFISLETVNTFEELDNVVSLLLTLVDNLGGH